MATQVGIDFEEIRKDLEATTEEKIVNVTEKNLWNQLIDYQKEKIMADKYRKFKLLLDHFSKSSRFKLGFQVRRTALCLLNVLSSYILYSGVSHLSKLSI